MASTQSTPSTYTVQLGDTFFLIAQKLYGDGSKWQAIYDANRDKVPGDPTTLGVGTVLTIPSA